MVLEKIEPKNVFKYFEEILNIPRGSKNEKAISDYLVNFAKKHSLEFFQDEHLNVVIRKNATKGYENSKGVILQGHMDMVCEKNNDTNHDFFNDPIKPRIVDDMIYATGTTLGADNGIAMAFALAVLESETISHPPLEVLITSEEEIGMGGALNLDASILKGEYLINIDSEEEGSLLVSCCGGVTTTINLTTNNIKPSENYTGYTIFINGLKGGHSGMDIIKQRGNSNKILGRILSSLLINNVDFHISSVNGGSKMNAIPRENICSLYVNKSDSDKYSSIINSSFNELKKEFKSTDEGINIYTTKENPDEMCFDKDTTLKIINILSLIPNGIDTMSTFINDLPQSSSNLGIVKTLANSIVFEGSIRSSISSIKEDILNRQIILSKSVGATISTNGDYPAWEYSSESNLRNVFISTFKDIFNKEPNITAIHAGLECGILKEKMPHLDIISFGPDHFDVHSPNEHVSISSTERMWNYLLEVLKRLK